ncbi:MAG: hypothetical protein ACRDP6_38995 [Actinoallomurus sp.]
MAEPTAYAHLHLNPADVASYATGHPLAAAVTAALAVTALVLVWRAVRRAVSGKRPENVLTVVAALIATTVQADGMWIFFRDIVPVPGYLRVLMFAFLEVALFTSGLRARRNVKETEEHTAGVDGIAVWVLAAISGTLASTTAGSFRGALLRLTAAAVAAWLWERGLTSERRRARKQDGGRGRRINWKLTPERVLVRLGVAESTDRTAIDVDAHRRLSRVARRAYQLRTLRAVSARPWRLARAQRRLDAAMNAAVEHAHLATDSGRQEELLAQIGALYGAAELAEITPDTPWPAPARRPRTRLYRVETPHLSGGSGFPFDTPDELAAWLDEGSVPPAEEPVPPAEEPVPLVLVEATEDQLKAARIFADEVQRGKVPGIRPIKKQLGVAQPKAREVQAYLKVLANQ